MEDPLDKQELLNRFLVAYGECIEVDWLLDEITEFCAEYPRVESLLFVVTEVDSPSRECSCKS